MEKLFALLRTRIWKTNLDNQTRNEMYNEVDHASFEVCNTVSHLIKRIRHLKHKEQVVESSTQKLNVYDEDRL